MRGRRGQTLIEEIFNGITCGAGLGLAVAGLAVLVVSAAAARDVWKIVAAVIYGSSLILLFLTSTLYHSITALGAKRVFEILDHCMIYVLIAGTYTPFTLVTLRGPWGWSLLGAVWGLAILGIVFKCFFVNRFRVLSAFIYLFMGWLVVVAIRPLVQNLAPGGVRWLLAGGVVYSAGLLFYAWRKLPFHHTLWHGFVLAGAVCHFFSVLGYVL